MEEIKKEEIKPVTEPEPKSMIDAAHEAAERLEKANAEKKVLLEREEKLRSMAMLSGRSEAGSAPLVEDPEVAKRRKAKEYFKGTSIERMIKV